MHVLSPSPESTRALAEGLAAALDERGLVIALTGPLGAGKTAFVKGLAAGLGLDPGIVASPTFVIACEYDTPDGRRLGHVDLYRVKDREELEAAGFLDLLEPGAVVAVEWADRLPEALPADHLAIRIGRPEGAGSAEHRTLDALASGDVAEAVLERWQARREGARL